jgi:SAM-dependent methyltransferase/uncharacterized protein YbaR (Trm112 family)
MLTEAMPGVGDLLDVLACPDCRGFLSPEPGTKGAALACACGLRFPVADGIPRLLSRALRERLGPEGAIPVGPSDVPSRDLSPENVVLANVVYHATEPEAYGAEPLASIGMFDAAGHAQHRLREVVELMAEGGSRDLLVDVGCGPGNVLAHAAPHFRRPVGVDVSPEMLRRARQAGFRAVAGDAGCLPFRDGVADAVTAFSFLHHLAQPDGFLAEACRVLRPGGFFYSDWDPNGATRDRSALFRSTRDLLVSGLDRLGLARKPRYYRREVRAVAELAEFGWHHGPPLEPERLRRELQAHGVAEVRIVRHDDCPSLAEPHRAALAKRVQRIGTLVASGHLDLLMRGREAAAEYFLLLGRKS